MRTSRALKRLREKNPNKGEKKIKDIGKEADLLNHK